jgi:hypothetical protein
MKNPIRTLPARARIVAATLLALVALATPTSASTILVENFDDVDTAFSQGWLVGYFSNPLGDTRWFQGNADIFTALNGAPDSYIAANFLNAGFGGDVDTWLATPQVTVNNGDTLSFYTRSAGPAEGVPGDQLQVLFNALGSNVITDFLPLATISNYPGDWTQYSVTVSGLSGPATARFAFRYMVNDTSVNGDYIGIDNVVVSTPEPSTFALLGIGCVAAVVRQRKKPGRSRV